MASESARDTTPTPIVVDEESHPSQKPDDDWQNADRAWGEECWSFADHIPSSTTCLSNPSSTEQKDWDPTCWEKTDASPRETIDADPQDWEQDYESDPNEPDPHEPANFGAGLVCHAYEYNAPVIEWGSDSPDRTGDGSDADSEPELYPRMSRLDVFENEQPLLCRTGDNGTGDKNVHKDGFTTVEEAKSPGITSMETAPEEEVVPACASSDDVKIQKEGTVYTDGATAAEEPSPAESR